MPFITTSKQFKSALIRKISSKSQFKVAPKVTRAFNIAKADLIRRISEDPLSQDFKAEGPLFGLFGFKAGDNPISDLEVFLESFIKIRIHAIKNNKGQLRVSVPSKEAFRRHNQFSLKWETGKSWVEAAETGGFVNSDQYMLKRGKGRSKVGVQIKGKVKRDIVTFKPRPYFNEALFIFRQQIPAIIN